MDYAASQSKDFSYCKTKDLAAFLTVRISSLEGVREKKPFTVLLDDPMLRFTGVQTSDHSDIYVSAQLYADNKPLTSPVRTSYKAFTKKWSWNEWITFPIKYCSLPLNAQLAITVWDIQGPRKVVPVGGTTFGLFGKNHTLRKGKQKLYLWPNVESDGNDATKTPSKINTHDEMDRLEKLMKKHSRGDMERVDWLDKIAFRKTEHISKRESLSSKKLFLYLDLPKFDFALVFSEKEYPPPSDLAPSPISLTVQQPPTYLAVHNPTTVFILDPELSRDNPIEDKHRRLVRSHRNNPLDRDLKPDPKRRDELNNILKYPPTQSLTAEEKDLIWEYRFYLTRDKRALTKFLKCVVWADSTEAKQAVDLLPRWANIDIDDALELLGRDFVNRSVRAYAVRQLNRADDEELLLYLLQLVQALKFERMDDNMSSNNTGGAPDSNLVSFLIERAVRNPVLGNLTEFLVSTIRYLMVECEDKIVGKMYAKVAYQFMAAMVEIPSGNQQRDVLRRQGELIASMTSVSREVRDSKEARSKKIDRLRSMISDSRSGLASFAPLPLPLDPKYEVKKIVVDKSSVFNSNLSPLRLAFSGVDDGIYEIIFKTGDDLRQDQLVIQIITLMDKLLRKENLDLKLTPYKVLATGSDAGLVQYIPSKPLATILAEHRGDLLAYLRAHHPDNGEGSVMGVEGEVMDTYYKSCAGYCVITYLLGVGDRHLDNLLLSPDGNVFHVDFGFILGRDPKPFPPPMKLCKEMIEAMGGMNSLGYRKFVAHCFTAYNILRKNANLILNLFALMVEANVPDIRIEPDKAVYKVQEKFRLDLTEEAAINFFQAQITESVSALFPQVIETIHKWAQYWRK